MGFFVLALIATAGFVASFACHLMGWLNIEPPWGESVFVLHIGCLVLGWVFMMFANRTAPNQGRANVDHLLVLFPKWVRVAASGFFGYAMVNLGCFVYCARQYPKHGVPLPLELRGFSGHWMFFYGAEAVGFIALALRQRR